jgi:hypothetical protein
MSAVTSRVPVLPAVISSVILKLLQTLLEKQRIRGHSYGSGFYLNPWIGYRIKIADTRIQALNFGDNTVSSASALNTEPDLLDD